MQIDNRVDGDILILTVGEPRIDAAGAVTFKDRMRGLIAGHDGRVVMDLQRVEFLDSSGLGALVAVMKMLDEGRRLELAGCGPIVSRVLSLTRMDRIFVLHDAVPDGDAAGRTTGQSAA